MQPHNWPFGWNDPRLRQLLQGQTMQGPPPPRGLFSEAAAAQVVQESGTPNYIHGPIGGRRRPPLNPLFKALVLSEDSVGPNGEWMTSGRGAEGPAQVRPRTAPEAARLAGLPWDERRYRTDPDYNLALGRAYYRRQLEEFHDPALAAAAYNWGPTRFRAAMREARRTGRPVEELLPRETRNYVIRFRKHLAAMERSR